MALPHRLGKYTLHTALGGGGMGRVYLATLEGTAGFQREIAVKLVRAELASSQRAIDMFLREGRALAALSHRNVIQVFELATEGDQLYLAMEYLRGLDLAQMRARGPLAWPAAAFIASEAARGLASAHAARSADAPDGIIHGDISPSNVMACNDGAVKVLDFGLARPVGNAGKGLSGKVPYLPPEVILGTPVDAGTDVYSLGIVLYEILTGTRLFRGDNEAEMMHRVVHDRVPRIGERAKGIPPALDALVSAMISKDRSARPDSAADVAEALDRIVDGRVGAADLADLVASLARPATESTSVTATPIGRTELVPVVRGGQHTMLASESGLDADGGRARSGTGRRIVIVLGAAAAIAGGVVFWQLRSSARPVPVSVDPAGVPMAASQALSPSPGPPSSEPSPPLPSPSPPSPVAETAAAEAPVAEAPAAAPPPSATPPTVHGSRRHPAAVARHKVTTTATTSSAAGAAKAKGSGGIDPGYLANPFGK